MESSKIPTITVHTKHRKDSMQYRGKEILTYDIAYPAFSSARYQRTLNGINREYHIRAMRLEAYCRKELFFQAAEQLDYDMQHGYPPMQYQAITEFDVTYNANGFLSLYCDKYLYTGGAHGSTTRTSDTWDVRTGRRVPLQRFFPRGFDANAYIIRSVNAQIAKQISEGNDVYFDDYEKNVAESFDPKNYYLTLEGIAVYFQQYAIAPYSTGIPVFIIPFVKPSPRR